ncbi:MAG: 50S ribosomal protein L11 methyltransferase [Desulfosudaceae bacterium]
MSTEERFSAKWLAATIEYTADAGLADDAVDIVADLFYRQGLKGVVIDDTAGGRETGTLSGRVTGYFSKDAAAADQLAQLRRMAAGLAGRGFAAAAVSVAELDEQDWAHFWKDHFYPCQIGRRLVVKPTWREYDPAGDDIVIKLDPGMAFGTGTHATTAMCLRLLESRLRPGDRFLDIGTGSGILLIAAHKLGAAEIRGVDNDPVAVKVARDNLRLNGIPQADARVNTADLTTGVEGCFDLVAANIQTETILDLIPGVGRVLAPGGRFLCSGIIAAKADQVLSALGKYGYTCRKQMEEDTWVCLAAERSRPAADSS